VKGEPARTAFAAPNSRLWSLGWQECRQDGALLDCLIDIAGPPGSKLAVRFDPSDPSKTQVTARVPGQADADVVPALIQVARPDKIEEIAPSGATAPDLALLIDPTGRRIFAATPGVIRSTLVRLVLLDGSYSPLFHKVDDHLAFDGERITAWRIEWGSQ
jgi:hypothetical protein